MARCAGQTTARKPGELQRHLDRHVFQTQAASRGKYRVLEVTCESFKRFNGCIVHLVGVDARSLLRNGRQQAIPALKGSSGDRDRCVNL